MPLKLKSNTANKFTTIIPCTYIISRWPILISGKSWKEAFCYSFLLKRFFKGGESTCPTLVGALACLWRPFTTVKLQFDSPDRSWLPSRPLYKLVWPWGRFEPCPTVFGPAQPPRPSDLALWRPQWAGISPFDPVRALLRLPTPLWGCMRPLRTSCAPLKAVRDPQRLSKTKKGPAHTPTRLSTIEKSLPAPLRGYSWHKILVSDLKWAYPRL